MRSFAPFLLFASILLPVAVSSCSSVYYSAFEKFGVHKRDILVDRVEKGREEQAEAKEQFQTTLEAFQELTSFDGGDLEALYKKLNKEYERSQSRADDVTDRIESIQEVSTDLFDEWQEELSIMENADLRGKSEDIMGDTRERYDALIGKMEGAAAKMAPVLTEFRDHVTFLKHNLNAQAITSLRDTTLEIEGDVASLVEDMQASIDEADAFISAMSS